MQLEDHFYMSLFHCSILNIHRKEHKKTRTEKEDEAIGCHKHSANRQSFSARWLRSCMSVIELQPVNRTVLVMEKSTLNTKNMTTRHQVTPTSAVPQSTCGPVDRTPRLLQQTAGPSHRVHRPNSPPPPRGDPPLHLRGADDWDYGT